MTNFILVEYVDSFRVLKTMPAEPRSVRLHELHALRRSV